MKPGSLLFFILLSLNAVVFGQGQTVKIIPADTVICKGESIRLNAYFYKGSFQFIGSFNGKDYFMDTVSRSWTDARSAAQANGMDLWIIESLQENDAVYNMLPLRSQSNTFFWFGLFQDPVLEAAGTVASGWKWVDGRSLDTTFKYWHDFPPFVEPDDVFQSSTGANYAALGLNNFASRWSDMTNTFPANFRGHAIAEANTNTFVLEWSNGDKNSGSINLTPLSTQSYFLDITYGGNKTRSNISSVTVNQAMATASFDVLASSDTCLISNNVGFANTTVSTDSLNTRYEWNFGDGNKSTSFSTAHQFGGAQVYTVLLTAKDINGCETYASRSVTVKPSPLIPVISFPSGGNLFCEGDSVVLNTVVVQPDPAATFAWFRNGMPAGSGRSIVARQNGTYLLECTNVNGCANKTSVSVKVNPLPSKPVLTIVNGFSDVICQLDSSYLQASTAINLTRFNWYTGTSTAPTLLPNISQKDFYVKGPTSMGNNIITTNYFMRTVDVNGCVSPISDSVSISIKPSPAVSLSVLSGKIVFCEGTPQNSSPLPLRLGIHTSGGVTCPCCQLLILFTWPNPQVHMALPSPTHMAALPHQTLSLLWPISFPLFR